MRTTSDPEGRFQIKIAPGHYVLIVASDHSGFPMPKPSVVDVESGVTTQVELLLDSGIR
jgi:hypothetical protein